MVCKAMHIPTLPPSVIPCSGWFLWPGLGPSTVSTTHAGISLLPCTLALLSAQAGWLIHGTCLTDVAYFFKPLLPALPRPAPLGPGERVSRSPRGSCLAAQTPGEQAGFLLYSLAPSRGPGLCLELSTGVGASTPPTRWEAQEAASWDKALRNKTRGRETPHCHHLATDPWTNP